MKVFFYRAALLVAPLFFRLVTKLLFATCRVHIEGMQIRDKFSKNNVPFIAAFWHYSIVYTIFRSIGIPWVCMVSASKDGEFIARILEGLGYKTVRGSKGRHGTQALKGMINAVKKGYNAAIVADGSKGPARKAQPGAVLLASMTGAPIVPVAWAADNYISFRSWDRTALPKPFSRIEFEYGEPIYIPKKLTPEEMEECRVQVENQLNALYEKLWGVFGKQSH